MKTEISILIDTKKLNPLRSHSFSPKGNNIDYTHPEVQKILIENFGIIFPKIAITDAGPAYQVLFYNNRKKEINFISAKSIADIPTHDLHTLLEGWIRIRRIIQDPSIDKNVKSIILNLRLPDPEKSIQQYIIAECKGDKGLIVSWGYDSDKVPSCPIDEALSKLLKVPKRELQKMLRTATAPETTTDSINVNTDTIQALSAPKNSNENPEKNTSKNTAIFLAAILSCTIIVASIAMKFMLQQNKEAELNTTKTTSYENYTHNSQPQYNTTNTPFEDINNFEPVTHKSTNEPNISSASKSLMTIDISNMITEHTDEVTDNLLETDE